MDQLLSQPLSQPQTAAGSTEQAMPLWSAWLLVVAAWGASLGGCPVAVTPIQTGARPR